MLVFTGWHIEKWIAHASCRSSNKTDHYDHLSLHRKVMFVYWQLIAALTFNTIRFTLMKH